MNDKFKRIMATGLLSSMIMASMASCDLPNNKEETSTNQPSYIEQMTNSNNTDINNETTHQTESETGQTNKPDNSQENKLKGDVWQAVLKRPEADDRGLVIKTQQDLIKYLPLPVRFLQDEGLITYNSGEMVINGETLNNVGYTPFAVQTAVDETTDANDVYLFVYYENADVNRDNYNDVWTATWKLKYTLDDDDYKTFLALENDFRARLFIQEMDKIYEPEVITKNVVAFTLTGLVNPVKTDTYNIYKSVFPKIYVDDINYETRTMTFAVRKDDGYAYVDINIDDSNAVDMAMRELGITDRQEMLDRGYYLMKTKNTILGECLTEFGYYAYTSRYGHEKSAELINQTETVDKLKFYYAGSTESTIKYDYGK